MLIAAVMPFLGCTFFPPRPSATPCGCRLQVLPASDRQRVSLAYAHTNAATPPRPRCPKIHPRPRRTVAVAAKTAVLQAATARQLCHHHASPHTRTHTDTDTHPCQDRAAPRRRSPTPVPFLHTGTLFPTLSCQPARSGSWTASRHPLRSPPSQTPGHVVDPFPSPISSPFSCPLCAVGPSGKPP